MIDERTNILIQRVLDGEATPHEVETLDALAAERPAIRTARADFETMNGLLASVRAVAPPADLKQRIMASLPEERYARAPVRPEPQPDAWSLATVFGALREALTARPAFSYAYAVALGAVVGIAAYVAVFDTATVPAPADAYGTLVAPDAGALASSGAHVIDADGVGGTVRVAHDGERMFLDLELDPRVASEVALTFDPDRLRWDGLTRLDGGANGTLTARAGEVRLALDGPARYRFSFAFDGPPPALTLTVSEGDATLYQRVLAADEQVE